MSKKEQWADKFAEITAMSHTDQAIWFLNGFWDELKPEAEKVWGFVHAMIEIQTGQPKLYGSRQPPIKEGCDIDEMQAHMFLEKMKETMTVVQLRKRLSALDLDNNKRMSLAEYMLDHFKKTPAQLCNAPQGDSDPAKLLAAQKAIDAAGEALNSAQDAAAHAKKAQDELAASVAALAAEEKALADKLSGLEAIANGNDGVVKKNKAKNEIEQMKAEDPLPLRKAKITQAAALKKAEKATAAAEVALQAAAKAFADAEEQLAAVKKAGGGVAQGRIFWMERELAEKKKFMPKK